MGKRYTDRWVAEGRRRLRALLRYMDRQYPGRIASVFFTGLQTGEFDYPIVDNDVGPDGKLDELTLQYNNVARPYRSTLTYSCAFSEQLQESPSCI